MTEKEKNTCIWIHHTATILGIVYSVRLFVEKRLRRCSLFVLVLFLEGQIWAVFKIMTDLRNGGSRLRNSFERIHIHSGNRHRERSISIGVTLASVLFKLGVPYFVDLADRTGKRR